MSVHCVVCFRDDSGSYYKNAYVTILSVFENTKESVTMHILHDETIHHGKKALEELAERYNQNIVFHTVPTLEPEVAAAITQRYSIGATYRYYIHELLDVDKAIYLDCDLIVNMDIGELYSVELGDKLLAAVLDAHSYWKDGKPRSQYKKMIEYHGLVPESYINTGVMVMNLKKVREVSTGDNICIEKTLASVRDNIPCYYPDMEIINSLLADWRDSILFLDERFNLWHNAVHLGIHDLQNTIFHFVMKPSTAFFPAHLLFWKYYAKAPFGDDVFEKMGLAYAEPTMNIVQLYLKHRRRRNHAMDFLQYGALGGLWETFKRRLKK